MRDHIFAASLKASAYLHSWRPTAYLLLLICSCSAQYDTDAVISDYLTTDPGGGTTGSCYNCDGVNKFFCPLNSGTCYYGQDGYIGCCTSPGGCYARTACFPLSLSSSVYVYDVDNGGYTTCFDATAPDCAFVANTAVIPYQYAIYCTSLGSDLATSTSYVPSQPPLCGSTADMPPLTTDFSTALPPGATGTPAITPPPSLPTVRPPPKPTPESPDNTPTNTTKTTTHLSTGIIIAIVVCSILAISFLSTLFFFYRHKHNPNHRHRYNPTKSTNPNYKTLSKVAGAAVSAAPKWARNLFTNSTALSADDDFVQTQIKHTHPEQGATSGAERTNPGIPPFSEVEGSNTHHHVSAMTTGAHIELQNNSHHGRVSAPELHSPNFPSDAPQLDPGFNNGALHFGPAPPGYTPYRPRPQHGRQPHASMPDTAPARDLRVVNPDAVSQAASSPAGSPGASAGVEVPSAAAGGEAKNRNTAGGGGSDGGGSTAGDKFADASADRAKTMSAASNILNHSGFNGGGEYLSPEAAMAGGYRESVAKDGKEKGEGDSGEREKAAAEMGVSDKVDGK